MLRPRMWAFPSLLLGVQLYFYDCGAFISLPLPVRDESSGSLFPGASHRAVENTPGPPLGGNQSGSTESSRGREGGGGGVGGLGGTNSA